MLPLIAKMLSSCSLSSPSMLIRLLTCFKRSLICSILGNKLSKVLAGDRILQVNIIVATNAPTERLPSKAFSAPMLAISIPDINMQPSEMLARILPILLDFSSASGLIFN